MVLCIYNLYPLDPERRNARQAMQNNSFLVHRTPEIITVSIPCHLIEKHFTEGASLTINLRAGPYSTPINLPKPVPRATSSWSTMEEGSQPSYQDVVEGIVESRTVDLRWPHLKMLMIPHMSHHVSQNREGPTSSQTIQKITPQAITPEGDFLHVFPPFLQEGED